jgi:glutaredoxin
MASFPMQRTDFISLLTGPPFASEAVDHQAPVASDHVVLVTRHRLGRYDPGHSRNLLRKRFGLAVGPRRYLLNFGVGRLGFAALESPPMPDSRFVVVYSRKGCHLCEVVKESLSKLSRRGGFTWRDVDVDADTELRRQFNDEVPVVFIDGRKAFKYKMDEQEFLRKLAS